MSRPVARWAHCEQRLIEERRRLLAELDSVNERARRSEALVGADTGFTRPEPGEEAEEFMARELTAEECDRETAELSAIDEALNLLYSEPHLYGMCVDCGGIIAEGRLAVVPWTRRCERHEEVHEA